MKFSNQLSIIYCSLEPSYRHLLLKFIVLAWHVVQTELRKTKSQSSFILFFEKDFVLTINTNRIKENI
jgi:hypothetical protein